MRAGASMNSLVTFFRLASARLLGILSRGLFSPAWPPALQNAFGVLHQESCSPIFSQLQRLSAQSGGKAAKSVSRFRTARVSYRSFADRKCTRLNSSHVAI